MNQLDIIHLTVPFTSQSSDILTESIWVILMRSYRLKKKEETTSQIQQAVRNGFSQVFETHDQINQKDLLPIKITVNSDAGKLTIELGNYWQQTFDLAISQPGIEIDETLVEDFGSDMSVSIISELMDEVSYTPQPGNNYWKLVKQLPVSSINQLKQGKNNIIQLELPATYKYLNVLGVCLESVINRIDDLAQSEKTSYTIQLAVQEICTNIINHAYSKIDAANRLKITVSFSSASSQLIIEIWDQAPQVFDLPTLSPHTYQPSFAKPFQQGILTGSAILFISMSIVNAGNYLFNLILGRWLGPAAFADLSLIVTLMLMVTLVTATLQTVAAKFSAAYTATISPTRLTGLRSWIGRSSWIFGGILLTLFVLGAPLWQQFFHTQSVWPFIILGLGLPIYFVQGVDRGILQGQTRFGLLSLSYQAEMWIRLIMAVILVALGWSVNGAVAALSLSFVATWLVARQVSIGLPLEGKLGLDERQTIIAFAGPVTAALIGQILINNSDILIVKRFFEAEVAGQYAALALIGRIVFFATWSVVTVLFPIVAQKHQRNEPHRHLLGISLGLVVLVSMVIIGATLTFPTFIVNILFGQAYLSIAPLLWLYSIATMLYALSNVIITYRLSSGDGGGSTLAVLAGVLQVLGLWFFHTSLYEVVMVQIYIMTVLLATLIGWDLWLYFRDNYFMSPTQQNPVIKTPQQI